MLGHGAISAIDKQGFPILNTFTTLIGFPWKYKEQSRKYCKI